MNIETIINKKQLDAICKKYHVKELSVFGSVLTDKFGKDSDIDFLISFNETEIDLLQYAENYFNILEELEKITGRKVDLVEKKSLSNAFFIEELEETKKVIYG